MTERWLPIPGWEGFYEVSDQGRVRSIDRMVTARNGGGDRTYRGKVLKLHPLNKGHFTARLNRYRRCSEILVHRLVLEAFVGPCPDGMVGCHNDGNPANNAVENLRWDTQSENGRDAVRHGRNRMANKTHCVRGHEFTEANTRVYVSALARRRICRACGNLESKTRRALRSAA